MRISDWSSDVCSSDLLEDHLARMIGAGVREAHEALYLRRAEPAEEFMGCENPSLVHFRGGGHDTLPRSSQAGSLLRQSTATGRRAIASQEIGRATWWARGCQ